VTPLSVFEEAVANAEPDQEAEALFGDVKAARSPRRCANSPRGPTSSQYSASPS